MKRIKIFLAQQIKEIDRLTIKNQGISSLQLMERAVDNLMPYIKEKISMEEKIHVFSGVGNNGGDGLVLARKLIERGYDVSIYVVPFSSRHSEDFEINYQQLVEAGIRVHTFKSKVHEKADVIVDAIFGVGLNRPAKGIAAKAIEHINRSGARVYAIDMPSGLFADKLNSPADPIVEAQEVFTFQFPKLSFFFSENEKYVPRFEIVDIGLDEDVIAATETPYFYLTDVSPLPPRRRFSAKWDYGHAVIIGGSEGKAGSVCLAAQAAFRMGAGWTSVYVPAGLCAIYQTGCPEIMCMAGNEGKYLSKIELPSDKYTAGIGPGMGTAPKTIEAFARFITQWKKPVVIDADGLNILALNKKLLSKLPEKSVLTPHIYEFMRLDDGWENSAQLIRKAMQFAAEHHIILVVKRAYTLITNGKELMFNASGNPALAKAGSGDVLTGMLTGLLAQGIAPYEAAAKAVYWHGKAADIWVERYAETSLSPLDLIDLIKTVIK